MGQRKEGKTLKPQGKERKTDDTHPRQLPTNIVPVRGGELKTSRLISEKRAGVGTRRISPRFLTTGGEREKKRGRWNSQGKTRLRDPA